MRNSFLPVIYDLKRHFTATSMYKKIRKIQNYYGNFQIMFTEFMSQITDSYSLDSGEI